MAPTANLSQRITGVAVDIAARLLRTRRLVRAPIWIYKARAGAVFGSRLLMLEHVGRTSGQHRYVVLEVVDHPTPGVYVVASGFGEAAQWFRNVQVNPRVRVYLRSHPPAHATAQVLAPRDADRAIANNMRRHPGWWARFKPVLEATLGSPLSDTDTELPMVELRLDAPRS